MSEFVRQARFFTQQKNGTNNNFLHIKMSANNEAKKLAALSSLALLKEDMDRGARDYTDYLRAFIEHAISKHAVDPINSETVAQALSSEFGLNLPDKVIQLVLQRMARDGVLGKQSGLFSLIPGKLPKHEEFDFRRASLNQQVESLLSEFESHLISLEINFSRAETLNALFGFLSQFAISYLRAYIFKTVLPDSASASDKMHILLADFIKNAQQSGSETFEKLITLVKGQMYANALLCPDLDGIKKNFRLTTFFLDTPLALHLLGYHGPQQKRSAQELVQLLNALNGKVCVFTHTLQEIINVIRNAAQWVDRPDGRGHVVRNARKEKLTRTDLLVRADDVEAELRSININIANNPDYEAAYQIGELNFQEALEERIEYYNDMAMRADVESVRAIYCLRGKTVPMRLEDSLAVVVTTNRAYARAAYEYGKNHNSTREVSPVITDFSLANIAWLKQPLEWATLVEVETLAACYAALEPNSSDWRRYLLKIDELASKGDLNPDEHALLRNSPISRRDMIDLISDIDDPALAGGSVRDILERITSDILAPTKAELADIKCALEKSQNQSLSERKSLEQEQEALNRIADWISKALVSVIIVLPLLIVIGLGLSAGAGLLSAFGLSVEKSEIVYFLVVFATIAGTMSTIFGFSFASSIDRLRKNISLKLKFIAHR